MPEIPLGRTLHTPTHTHKGNSADQLIGSIEEEICCASLMATDQSDS